MGELFTGTNCSYAKCSVAGARGLHKKQRTGAHVFLLWPSSLPLASPLLADPKRKPAVEEMNFLETATPASQSRIKKAGFEAERWLHQHSFRAPYAGVQGRFSRDEE